MKFRTEVELPQYTKKLGYRHQSLMIGSCFAENIGNWLRDRCLPVLVNPFGILYNPISLANSLELLIHRKSFTDKDLFFSNGRYHSFSHHSRFSDIHPANMLERINHSVAEAGNVLNSSGHLLITFGTSWVFQHRPSGEVVSNCHKLPSSVFNRYCLSVAQITERWIPVIEQLKQMNPDLHLVLTVSPIRHLKDGAHENQLSKSTLLLAIASLTDYFGNDSISYFPSYELVLDELRDYRFYAADMTHPSEVALDFIREKFAAALLDQEAQTILGEVEKLLPALLHKPMKQNNTDYNLLMLNQLEKTNRLQIRFPFADFSSLSEKFREKSAD
jgi:hypothetical protein